MKKVYTAVLFSFAIAFILASCNKDIVAPTNNILGIGSARSGDMSRWDGNVEDESVGTEPEERDGILHFKNPISFYANLEKLGNMNSKERLLYNESKNFKSLSFIYNEFEQQVAQAGRENDKAKFDNILKKYASYAKFNEDSSFTYSISDPVRASVLNSENLVYIGKMLYYFDDNSQKIVFDGDKTKLNLQSSDAVVIFTPKGSGRQAAVDLSCPTGFEKNRVYSQTRDRMIVSVTKYINYWGNNQYDVVGTIHCLAKTELSVFWYWQVGSSSSPNKLYSRWTLVAQPPIPLQPNIQEEDNLQITTTSNSQATSLERTGVSVQLSNLSSTQANNTTVYVSFPGTGYWSCGYIENAGRSPFPMTCP